MPLWIAVHLSHLSLDILCPGWRTEAVVVFKSDGLAASRARGLLVHACSPLAQQLGIRLGMRRTTVETLSTGLRYVDHDAHAEAAACQNAALALLQYTPELALAPNNTLLLNVAASLSLFGGPLRIQQHLRATLQRLGLSAITGLAPTAQGAWLLANSDYPRRRTLRCASLHKCLDRLPCSDLPAAQPYLPWLNGIGCTTLGMLRKLPRAGIKRRCDQHIIQQLDQAYGQAEMLLNWYQPPPTFCATIEVQERLDYASAVLHIAQQLVERLCGWLSACQRAVTRLEFMLHHERGRHAIEPTPLILSLGEPAWQAEHLHLLLREHLARTTLPAGVIALTLNAHQTDPREPTSHSLFPEPGGTAGDRQRVMELLIARLGPDKVLQPGPIADHRPERANQWLPLDQRCNDAAAALHHPQRPFWLLPEPIPLRIEQHRPVYGSPLRIVSGPERIEDGWWDSGLTLRDYFIAESGDGARYWLYQERSNSAGWFLHGLFA